LLSTALPAGQPPFVLLADVGRPAARFTGWSDPTTGWVGRTAVNASWPLSIRPPSAVIRR
jgi:hypothetical protein